LQRRPAIALWTHPRKPQAGRFSAAQAKRRAARQLETGRHAGYAGICLLLEMIAHLNATAAEEGARAAAAGVSG